MTYKTIDDWLNEIENSSMRLERLLAEIGPRGLVWVREAWRLAAEARADSTTIKLSAEDYDAFVAALDAPPKPNAKLQELMRRKPTWEKPE